MGAKDAKAREFLSNNERFADLFNFYLFKGKQVIKPSDLQEKDTATVLSLYGIDKKEVQKQRWRDQAYTSNYAYCLLGSRGVGCTEKPL